MIYSEFATYVRWLTKTNSTTFTDADLVAVANPTIEQFAQEIAKVNEDYFGMVFFRDLIAGQRDYSFPSEICNNMKRLEICIAGDTDPTTGNKIYSVADEFDLNLFQHSTDEPTILRQFSGRKPAFELYGGSIWIYSGESIIDIADGLKLWAIMYPQRITTADLATAIEMEIPKTSTSFGLKRQFHNLLALKISIKWKGSRDKPIPLSRDEITFDQQFQDAVESIRGLNLDRAFTATVPQNDGSQY